MARSQPTQMSAVPADMKATACAIDARAPALSAERSRIGTVDSSLPGTVGNLKSLSAGGKPVIATADAARKCGGKSSGEGGADTASANVVMQVLPWLLLLLTLAGFLWWCSSLLVVQEGTTSSPESLERSQPEEAWENVPLPIIALLIVAGYALAILAMLYLPPMLGPEASIWALLTALVFMLTWKWWLPLLLELVFMAHRVPVNCLAVVAAACCLLPAWHIFSGGNAEDPAASDAPRLGKKVKSLETLVLEEPGTPIGDLTSSASRSFEDASSASADSASSQGSTVYLHVYDITHEGKIETLNSLLAPRLSPLKLGGLFHAGVEVNGKEWSFGYCNLGTGVSGITPRSHPAHHFRETIRLPRTQLSEEKIVGLIKAMSSEYQGCDYSLFQKNCLHFADDFCQRLGVGGVPLWMHRLVRTGEWLCECVLRISQIFEAKGMPATQSAKTARI